MVRQAVPISSTDLTRPSPGDYSNMNLTATINAHPPLNWTIEWYQSSSCGVRSAVSCYNLAHKYTFPAEWLLSGGWNQIVLGLPYNATDLETAILPVGSCANIVIGLGVANVLSWCLGLGVCAV